LHDSIGKLFLITDKNSSSLFGYFLKSMCAAPDTVRHVISSAVKTIVLAPTVLSERKSSVDVKSTPSAEVEQAFHTTKLYLCLRNFSYAASMEGANLTFSSAGSWHCRSARV